MSSQAGFIRQLKLAHQALVDQGVLDPVPPMPPNSFSVRYYPHIQRKAHRPASSFRVLDGLSKRKARRLYGRREKGELVARLPTALAERLLVFSDLHRRFQASQSVKP